MDSLRCHPCWKMFLKDENRFISWVPLDERIPYTNTNKEVGRIYTYLPYKQYTDIKGVGYFFYYRIGLLKELLKYWAEDPENYIAPVWPLIPPIIDQDPEVISKRPCKHIYIGAIRPLHEVLKDY